MISLAVSPFVIVAFVFVLPALLTVLTLLSIGLVIHRQERRRAAAEHERLAIALAVGVLEPDSVAWRR